MGRRKPLSIPQPRVQCFTRRLWGIVGWPFPGFVRNFSAVSQSTDNELEIDCVLCVKLLKYAVHYISNSFVCPWWIEKGLSEIYQWNTYTFGEIEQAQNTFIWNKMASCFFLHHCLGYDSSVSIDKCCSFNTPEFPTCENRASTVNLLWKHFICITCIYTVYDKLRAYCNNWIYMGTSCSQQ